MFTRYEIRFLTCHPILGHVAGLAFSRMQARMLAAVANKIAPVEIIKVTEIA